MTPGSALHRVRENSIEFISIIKQVIATKTSREWLRILGEEVGISCSSVLSMDEVVTDPQVLENEYIIEFDHPVLGRVKLPGFPVGLSETPATVRSAPLQFGQHTEEVLLEVGGYNWDEIAELREQEVIRHMPLTLFLFVPQIALFLPGLIG